METTEPAGTATKRRRMVAAVSLGTALVALAAWFGCDAAPTAVESPTTPTTRTPAPPTETRERHAAKTTKAAADGPVDERKTEAPSKDEGFWRPHALRVTVVVADDGRPLEGALVLVDERSVRDLALAVQGTTGADGVARLALDPGKGEHVAVRKVGFVTARKPVPRDAPNEMRVELAAGVAVRGRVVFADSRAPAAGVRVRAWTTAASGFNDDAETDVARITDEEGRFELAGVPLGKSVQIFAAKPGYRTADALVTRDGPGADVELVLGDGGVLEGFVYDIDGNPAPDVNVYLLRTDMDVPDSSWTDADTTYASWAQQGFIFPATPTDAKGRYEFKGVRLPMNGVQQPRLAAARDAKGRTAKSGPATFTHHAERMQRDIRFAAAPAITVRVSWASPPRDSFKIRVQPNGPNRTSEFERTLAPGVESTTFEGLREGLYFVSVSTGDDMRDGIEAMREVTVKDGDRAEVAFAPTGDKRIEGVVVDAADNPVSGAVLKFETGDRMSEGSFQALATTRGDGSFLFEGLTPTPGTIELDEMLSGLNRRMRGMSENRDAPEELSFAELRVRDVTPGGPSLRIVVQRAARVTGRFVPPPAGKNRVQFGAVNDDHWGVGSLVVDKDGNFSSAVSVVARPVDLYFKQEGFAPVVLTDRVAAPGAALDLGEIKFEAGLTFDGALRDAAGRALANAEIYGNDPWIDRRAETDAEGKFRLEHLPRRTVHLSVRATQGAASWRLTIDPAVLSGTFTIGEDVAVAGRVLDASGAPARGVGVYLLPSESGRFESAGSAYFETDAEGRFSVRVAPGRFRVEVRRRAYVAAVSPATIEIKDGDDAPLELRLR